MESVYHFVTIRVNETSWAHVWRLRSLFLGTGYDSHSSFALVVSCVMVRSFFLFLAMPMMVASGRSKPMRVGHHTGILRLRAMMDVILF
jgi:hypothetical protein